MKLGFRIFSKLLRPRRLLGALALAGLTLSSAGCQSTPQAAPDVLTPQMTDAIDAVAASALNELPLAGLTIGVRLRKNPVYLKGYGEADREAGTPAGPDTIYPIGALTEQFTAAAIMQLVDEGKIDLDNPITDYLPGYPATGNEIAVRNLLNHTSGLPSYANLLEEVAPGGADRSQIDPYQTYTPDQLVAMFKDRPLDFTPDSQWGYSDSDYVLLGLIIEQVSGQTYAEYLQARIFEPLGLKSTSYCTAPPGRLAQGYQIASGNFQSIRPMNASVVYAAGGLCSTAIDLLAWQQALVSGRVVSADSYQTMAAPGTLANGDTLAYGYGLDIGAHTGRNLVFQNGRSIGYRSALLYYPDEDLALVMLANTETPDPTPFETLVSQIALSILPTNQPPSFLAGLMVIGAVGAATLLLYRVFQRRRASLTKTFAVNEALAAVDQDQEALDRLSLAGSNLMRPHTVDFFFRFADEPAARGAAREIQNLGYAAKISRAGRGSEWICSTSKYMVPQHEVLVGMRKEFEAIAKTCQGEYAGWGARIVK